MAQHLDEFLPESHSTISASFVSTLAGFYKRLLASKQSDQLVHSELKNILRNIEVPAAIEVCARWQESALLVVPFQISHRTPSRSE